MISEKIMVKNVLVPRVIDRLKNLGNVAIEKGRLYLELAELLEQSSLEDALSIIDHLDKG